MSKVLTAQEAAAYLCCSYVYLAKLRQLGTGPAFFKMGSFIKYKEADLNEWLDARRVIPIGVTPARSPKIRELTSQK